MNVEECIEKGLLKKNKGDFKKALRSISAARNRLKKAAQLKEAEFYEEALVNAYSAMFHAGRAILFKDGMKERSHYALYVYLKEKYSDKIEPRFLNELDSLRMERHEILYALDSLEISEEEIEHIISVTKNFISAVEKIIKSFTNDRK